MKVQHYPAEVGTDNTHLTIRAYKPANIAMASEFFHWVPYHIVLESWDTLQFYVS